VILEQMRVPQKQGLNKSEFRFQADSKAKRFIADLSFIRELYLIVIVEILNIQYPN